MQAGQWDMLLAGMKIPVVEAAGRDRATAREYATPAQGSAQPVRLPEDVTRLGG